MRSRTKQQGVAAVEFGLLVPVLVLLAFGVSEYGRAMYQYNAITKSTRDAARYLSTQAAGDATAIAAAKCLVVYGKMACTGTPLLTSLNTSQVQIQDAASSPGAYALQPIVGPNGTSGATNLVSVAVVGYQFAPLVNYVMTSTITFNTISATMFQAP